MSGSNVPVAVLHWVITTEQNFHFKVWRLELNISKFVSTSVNKKKKEKRKIMTFQILGKVISMLFCLYKVLVTQFSLSIYTMSVH